MVSKEQLEQMQQWLTLAMTNEHVRRSDTATWSHICGLANLLQAQLTHDNDWFRHVEGPQRATFFYVTLTEAKRYCTQRAPKDPSEPAPTVLQVKQFIESREGTPVQHQELISQGKRLDNSQEFQSWWYPLGAPRRLDIVLAPKHHWANYSSQPSS